MFYRECSSPIRKSFHLTILRHLFPFFFFYTSLPNEPCFPDQTMFAGDRCRFNSAKFYGSRRLMRIFYQVSASKFDAFPIRSVVNRKIAHRTANHCTEFLLLGIQRRERSWLSPLRFLHLFSQVHSCCLGKYRTYCMTA